MDPAERFRQPNRSGFDGSGSEGGAVQTKIALRQTLRPLPAWSAREFGRMQTCPLHRFQITAGPPGQGESQMEIDRRKLLSASACLALVKLVGPKFGPPRPAGLDEPPWQPLTRSLLDRARQASLVDGRTNRALIENLIHQEAETLGYAEPPVIKWLADPFDAFEYLSRLGLDELLQVDATRLWRRAGPAMDFDDDRLNSAAVLGSGTAGLVRSAEHDSALMAPKLLSKARVMAESASA